MATYATAKPKPIAPPASPAELLRELKDAHDKLVSAMSELQELICGEPPEPRHFSSIRWKLSAASLARRMLWVKILANLRPGACDNGTEKLRELQHRDIVLLRASTEHVGRWTADRALQDWPGYCAASRMMMSKMAGAIQFEQSALYDLLEGKRH